MLSTRTVLLLVLLGLMAAFSVTSLLIVGLRMRQQVRTDFSNELNRSLGVFENVEAERLQELTKEDHLLADLPSLKALLTTNDDRTIEDGAVEFWQTSGNDVFALTDPHLRVRAAFVRGLSTGQSFRTDVSHALLMDGRHYLVSENHLFHLTAAPVYFGSPISGTLLGYAVTGDLIDTAYQTHLSKEAGANAVFVSNGVTLASSLALPQMTATLSRVAPSGMSSLTVDGQRNLALSRDLSIQATRPLLLVFFRSLQGPDLEIRDIGRLLLLTGAGILLLGSRIMVLVAHRLTRPLEDLAHSVRSFETDVRSFETDVRSFKTNVDGSETEQQVIRIPVRGTHEVRQLAFDFAAMQKRVELSNRARLESERLATIGSMASSISHDLRHYLASIYANAEFLATPDTTEVERAEFFQDIKTAVMGTTDMLESLMIFSRTGHSAPYLPECLEALARRAIDQVRTHPDAAGVTVALNTRIRHTTIAGDGRQVERAFYNLLLNACQSAAAQSIAPLVTVDLVFSGAQIAARIMDNGRGVSPAVADAIFDPFVSEGKQNGTGLGLTLCRRIAEEHGGRVRLISSMPGETIFELTLPRLTSNPTSQSVSHAGGMP